MPQDLFFEDFHIGQMFHSARSVKVTAEEIKEFGQKYDPQPFHLDEAAGEGSFFKGLAASGWLTAAIVMRLRVESIKVFGGMIGAGVEEMRWTEPVRPGDTLRTEIEVVGVRQSASRKNYGIVRTRTLAFNQRNQVVLRSTVNFLAPLRATASA
jgi:acyl dehydratase